jgi:hypothetical protein
MHTLTRALIVAGLSAAAWTAWQAADHTTAHAAERPPAAEQTGGPIGSLLGEAAAVVDEVASPPPVDDNPEPKSGGDDAPSQDAPPPSREPGPPVADTPLDGATGQVSDTVGEAVDQVPTPAVPEPVTQPAAAADAVTTVASDSAPSVPPVSATTAPVLDAAVVPDVGVGPPVPAPIQLADDSAPAPECTAARSEAAAQSGEHRYVPPNTNHGRRPRKHRRHVHPAPRRPHPVPPSDGVPAGAAATAGNVHLAGAQHAVAPDGAVRTRLGRGQLARSGHRAAVDRAGSISPTPA